MTFKAIIPQTLKWILVASLLGSGLVMAQSEPTMNQVYAAAQAGKLDDAQVMIQQVLVAHPKSAKAFFVQAELFARQGKLDRAGDSLASAEKLSPGLAFAKPEAVQALRAQLVAKAAPRAESRPSSMVQAPALPAAPAAPSWGLPLLLAGGVIVVGYFIFRRRNPAPILQPQAYVNQNGLGGAQTFGNTGVGAVQPAYPQSPGYPQQANPQPAGSGMGGRVMGGLATGLAVGAGVMAAQAIGRNLMGDHKDAAPAQSDRLSGNDYQAANTNSDMGGANFGVNDASSWDDGGGADQGAGGGDWDT